MLWELHFPMSKVKVVINALPAYCNTVPHLKELAEQTTYLHNREMLMQAERPPKQVYQKATYVTKVLQLTGGPPGQFPSELVAFSHFVISLSTNSKIVTVTSQV